MGIDLVVAQYAQREPNTFEREVADFLRINSLQDFEETQRSMEDFHSDWFFRYQDGQPQLYIAGLSGSQIVAAAVSDPDPIRRPTIGCQRTLDIELIGTQTTQRRQKHGTMLVHAINTLAAYTTYTHLRATVVLPESVRFWESLGFMPDFEDDDNYVHAVTCASSVSSPCLIKTAL